MAERVLLGSQGWIHPEWIGSFYPGASGDLEMLQRYASQFSTVEVADTFSGIPPESLMKSWHGAVPSGFKFSLRVPQQVTHEKRFVDSERLLVRFLERASLLRDKLGTLLIALPVRFAPNEDSHEIMTDFLKSLPTDFSWVVECRRADWLTDDFLEVLGKSNVALALVEGRWIKRSLMLDLARRPTADFMYIRFMGRQPSSDITFDRLARSRTMSTWSTTVAEMRRDMDFVAVYFSAKFSDSDSPQSVHEFGGLLGERSCPPASVE